MVHRTDIELLDNGFESSLAGTLIDPGHVIVSLVANGIWVILDATCEQWCMALLFEPSGPRAEQWNVVSTSFILFARNFPCAVAGSQSAIIV